MDGTVRGCSKRWLCIRLLTGQNAGSIPVTPTKEGVCDQAALRSHHREVAGWWHSFAGRAHALPRSGSQTQAGCEESQATTEQLGKCGRMQPLKSFTNGTP